MDRARYQRVREILLEAGGRTGAARDAYLAGACGSDAALRHEVERLLGSAPVATADLAGPVDPEPALDVPERLGRFRIGRELGRGGMGVVFEATDEDGGDRVAVKVLYPHLVRDARAFERFAREAEMGRRVRHDNVVRTLAVGTEPSGAGTLRYLVMERVEGRSLRELLDDLGTVPETLLREIARQAAAGLTAIHDAGIVHRDLKPENLLITDEPRVRIMDLGIAKAREATIELTLAGQFLGSLQYAAPEQIDLRDVGPAADLYALGVLLYELATGTNPFRHETPGAVIRAHLQTTPPPASERNPELSPFLSDVLATLLAKDPAARFADCRALEEVLRDGERSAWWAARQRRRRDPVPPRIGVRRETPLFGRAAELESLRGAWQRALAGRGGAVLVEGETGIGKSRLVDELVRGHVGADAHVLYGSFAPPGGVRGWTAAVTEKFGTVRLAEALRPYLADAPALVDDLAAYVRREPTSIADDAVEAACCHLLAGLAAERATLWVLEDLHFAPKAARGVALALARHARDRHALVLLTAQPSFDAPGVEERLALGRLGRKDVVELVHAAGGHAGARFGETIARKADGVPFFALELARSVRDAPEDARAVPVPSALRDVLAARLGDLSAEERALLDVGAVQGFEFDADLVAAALAQPVVTVLQRLAEIERRRGVVRACGRLYRFDHHQIREVLYGELPVRLREEYHTRLADARAGDPPSEARDFFLARHLLHGREPRRGLAHLDAALRHARGRFLNEDALDLLERAAPHAEDRRRFDLVLEKARVLDIMGRREPQRAASEEAAALADALGDPALQARAHLALGTYFSATSLETDALATYERALAFAVRTGDPTVEAAARNSVGATLARLRRDAEAIEHHERARALARDAGDPDQEMRAEGHLGMALRHLARFEDARLHYARALELAVRTGDRRAEAYNAGSLGVVLWRLGELEEAQRYLERRLRLGAEMGDRRAESAAVGNLGVVVRDLGRLEEARDLFRRHAVLSAAIGARRSEIVACLNLGRLELDLGNHTAARTLLASAREMAPRLHAPHVAATALVEIAELDRREGRTDEARAGFARVLAEAEAIDDRAIATEARCGLARVALDAGTPEALQDGVAHADEAVRVARTLGVASHHLVACAVRARLPGGADAAAEARRVLAESGDRIGVVFRLEGIGELWAATGDEALRAQAREAALRLLDRAPPQARDAMRARPAIRAVLGDDAR